MSRIFNRGAQVTIARPLAGSFTKEASNAVVIRDLRVTFRVEKNLRKEPNTAEVTITNLGERTRGEVQKKPLFVRIDAGYDGVLERLFVGNLRWGSSVLDGVEWTTTLELADGDRAFRYARVSRSFKAGVTAKTAVVEAARAMGYTVKLSATAARELNAQYVSGLALEGRAGDELARILAPYGMSWSIQDNSLQILRANEFRANEALVISQDTGMVGSPEYGAPPKKGGKPVLSVVSALKPQVTPGGRISVQAKNVTGVFRVNRVTHRGDTHGGEFVSEMEATAA